MDIEKIISLYKENGSVWKTGSLLGLTGQNVHAILNRNGVSTKRPEEFTEEQLQELRLIYENGFKCGDGELNDFCLRHNKLKSNTCRKARRMGFGTSRERKFGEDLCKKVSERAKLNIQKNGHPRGMLGKKHSAEVVEILSKRSLSMWANPESVVNSEEFRQKISDRSVLQMDKRLKENRITNYSRTKSGFVEVGGKRIFARSSWEANVSAYFEFLKVNGNIKDWEHEPETFWFLQIKRGVRSYRPDFKITNSDSTFYYVEVKGWMDDKSKTKIKRFAKYYPEFKLDVIDLKRYNEIKSKSGFIPNWGLLDNAIAPRSKKK